MTDSARPSEGTTSQVSAAFKTQEEAEREVAWYEENRCACGGSPITLDPGSQRHLATCTAILDYFKQHNHYPWEANRAE